MKTVRNYTNDKLTKQRELKSGIKMNKEKTKVIFKSFRELNLTIKIRVYERK